MCSVGALIGFQVASGTAGFLEGRQQAKSQRSFQRSQEQAVVAGALDQESQIAVQGRQAQEEIARQKDAAARAARRARASSVIAQIEGGREGVSARNEIRDLFSQEADFQDALDERGDSLEAATQAQLRGLEAQTLSQQNQILRPVKTPTLLGSALGIGSNVAQTLVFADKTNKKAAT